MALIVGSIVSFTPTTGQTASFTTSSEKAPPIGSSVPILGWAVVVGWNQDPQDDPATYAPGAQETVIEAVVLAEGLHVMTIGQAETAYGVTCTGIVP